MNFNNSVIDWKQVDNVISSSNRILLTTHENPDGDGLGSEVACNLRTKSITIWILMSCEKNPVA